MITNIDEFLAHGLTATQIEIMLEDLAVKLYAEHEHVPETTYIKNQSHKWRASSAMQKAIRRGNKFNARRMANGLHTLDPDYVWRRLGTIVIEDVGVGDPVLVALFYWISGKKAWRNKNGVDRAWLLMFVEMMCDALHDRNACDLLVWADLAPNLEIARQEAQKCMAEGDLQYCQTVYMSKNTMLAERMIAGWVMAGTKRNPGVGFKNSGDGHIKNIIASSTLMGQPQLVQMIVWWGASKQQEGMPMAFPLIWELASHALNNDSVGVDDQLTDLPMIGNYPSEAFDWHNQEGKRALSYFKKACEPMAKLLEDAKIPQGNQLEALGTILFRVEGHQVSKRLIYDGSQDLVDVAEMAHLMGNHVPAEYCDKAMRLMSANLPLLHYARKKVINALPPGITDEKPTFVDVE